MKPLVNSVITELQSEELKLFRLLDITLDNVHYRYTDCDIAIVLHGNRYTPRAFEVDNIRYSNERIVDDCTITLDNIDRLFTPMFVGGTPRGADVKLSLVLMDANNNIITVDVTESTATSFWESSSDGNGIKPIIQLILGELGFWEYNEVSGGIMPIAGSASDDFWEVNPVTGGLMPK